MRVTNHDPRVPDSMIGRMVYDYQIVKKLAEGGMGAVYLAQHSQLVETRKVIKVLLPEYTRNPIIRQRFEREAKAISKLKHDNILGIDGFGTLDDGQLFLMIPFLEGQSLDAYLRSRGGRLSEHRALHIIVQLCDALDHAHANGIVHRDLKPGNVFVVPTKRNPYDIRLLDFGIAKLLGDDDIGPDTKSGIAVGTPSYMAVEQYEHADTATHLADVYSLAIMIWEIVTGRLPWSHHDHAVLYFQQRTMVPTRPPLEVMSVAWADILLTALSVEPSARPQSVRELAVALASALPAIGRVPSGAEILADLAPHFVEKASPTDETVRNASEVDRIGPLLWPTRETAPGPQGLPPLNVVTSTDQRPTPEMLPHTSDERPSAPPTTLTASAGSSIAPNERTTSRVRLAAVAGSMCVVATLGTWIIASRWSGPTMGPRSSAIGGGVDASTAVVPDAVHSSAITRVHDASPMPSDAASEGDGAAGPINHAKPARPEKTRHDTGRAVRQRRDSGSAAQPPPARGSAARGAFNPDAIGGDE
jgi:serine/threonine protein kinase